MRSAALAVGLAVLLASGAAGAKKMPGDYEPPPGGGYHPVTETAEVLAEGSLRASVQGSTLRPMRGYTPVEVVLQNALSQPRVVRLSFRAHGTGGGRASTRTVEVAPGQRLTTWLLVPAATPAGNVVLDSPGVESHVISMYMEGARRAAVLVLGTQAGFDAATAVPKADRDTPRFSARFIAAQAAPRELAAYVGYDAVVLLEDVASLPADVWAALEGYAATGGHLVLPRPPRDVRERLPLLSGSSSGELHPYGFGRVRLCGGSAEACGRVLEADVLTGRTPVNPAGPPTRWERSSNALRNGAQPLLSSAQAPLGRFLTFIFLFTLVVGPGGLMLARRKGPVWLLVAVPGVALVTCLAIVVDSVLVDGFGVHSSRYSYTWLDRARDRAVTVGLGAWYANLSPGRLTLPATSALLAPDEASEQLTELDASSGLTVGAGFLPSRTYREWGEVAVVPSRARLVVRREGEALRVQNALGAPLESGLLRLGASTYTLPALADGAEGEAALAPSEQGTLKPLEAFLNLPDAAEGRFGFEREGLLEALPQGGFVARVGGGGFSPVGAALPAKLQEGVHLVRGEVDGP